MQICLFIKIVSTVNKATLTCWLLCPVAGPRGGPGVGQRLDGALGWPVVLESGARGEVALDLLQRHHRADLVGEELVPDALHLAAELEVGQVPALHTLRLQLEVV